MNAVSKGVSIGIYAKGKDKDLDAAKGGSQPYVELMGRRFVISSSCIQHDLYFYYRVYVWPDQH